MVWVSLVSVLAMTTTVTMAVPFGHNFSTAGAAWWGDFGYSLLDPDQTAFVAKYYKVASLEKCTGQGQGVKTEDGIHQIATNLKALNPEIKVMFYWSCTQAGIGCYAANTTFQAHPEWWLKDDNGKVVGSGGDQDGPRIDPMNAEAVDWWISVPLAGVNAGYLYDGVLADDSGYDSVPNISVARSEVLYAAKLSMISGLQAKFDAVGRDGVVFGNGLNEYDQDPQDPHSRDILEHVKGIQNEHFAAFEQVYPNGSIILDKASDVLDEIEWASHYANGSKQVFWSFWAGPYRGFKNGWPMYADDSQPCGSKSPLPPCKTQADTYDGWKAELVKYLPFNLAAFLTVASTNTWFTQAVWYELHQGFVNCPKNPGTCALPDDFYPILQKPLGLPKGSRVTAGPYKWTREFEFATVTLDLTNPVGGSGIVFHSDVK